MEQVLFILGALDKPRHDFRNIYGELSGFAPAPSREQKPITRSSVTVALWCGT